MRAKIFTTEFWKITFGFKSSKKLPEPEHMAQKPTQIPPTPAIEIELSKTEEPQKMVGKRAESEPIENSELLQPEKPKDVQEQGVVQQSPAEEANQENLSKSQILDKTSNLIVRSELNLEQNSVFTVSTYRGNSREIVVRETSPGGEITERKAIIGKTAGGFETGVLTTHHFKVYLALLELWEKAGRPVDKTVHFTTLKVIKRLGMKDSGEEYRRLKRWLRELRQIPVTFVNAFYIRAVAKHTDLADMTILNHLHVYERNNVGREKKTRGYGEFQFDRHILASLVNNHSHPLRLDVIKDFRKHKDLAILLYTYLDRNLAIRPKYEIRLEKLFDHLDLSQGYIPYPAKRKHRLEPVLEQLRGKPLSTGILSYCRILKTKDDKDYKLVCRKKPASKKLENGKEEPLQLVSQPELELEPKEHKSELLSSLLQKGLTEKQAKNLLSEKGEDVVKAQLDYLPFRLEEYKGQGREVNEAAIFYESIKDNWQPPVGHFQAEKEQEKEAKRQVLEEELKERVKRTKPEAEEWAARPPEDRIKGPLNFWIEGEKRFNYHHPTEEEIETKTKELISGLPTREEYEQRLIYEIEKDIQDKQRAI